MVTAGASKGIPREQRTCKMCQAGQIETAEHFVSDCPFFREERRQCLGRIAALVMGNETPALCDAIANARMELFLGDGFLRRLPAAVAKQVDETVCNYLKVAWRKRKDVWKTFCVSNDEWRLKDAV